MTTAVVVSGLGSHTHYPRLGTSLVHQIKTQNSGHENEGVKLLIALRATRIANCQQFTNLGIAKGTDSVAPTSRGFYNKVSLALPNVQAGKLRQLKTNFSANSLASLVKGQTVDTKLTLTANTC